MPLNRDYGEEKHSFGQKKIHRFKIVLKWAEEEYKLGDPLPLAGLQPIEKLIEDDTIFSFDYSKCESPCGWDGAHPRCFCGACRVYWVWNPTTRKWRAEAA